MNFSIDYSVYESGKRAPQYTIDSDLHGEMTLDELLRYTKSSLIVIADQVLREEQEKGFDKKPVVEVDGRKDKPVIQVSPFGKIQFTARSDIRDILVETFEGIWERSKRVTGEYISSHYCFLNGVEIARSPAQLKVWFDRGQNIGDRDFFRFVNTAPYARRLERLGVTAQRSLGRTVASKDKKKRSTVQIAAPNGVYFLTAKAISRKYKSNSKISFGFIPGSQIGLSATFKTGGRGFGRGGRRSKKPSTYLYPSIKILVSESGIL